MKYAQILALPALVAIAGLSACQQGFTGLERLIDDYRGYFPIEIWQYEYQGNLVYYVPLARLYCCDLASIVYDSNGERICAPDGGITGMGDGECPDFLAKRSGGELVWCGVRDGSNCREGK